MTHVSKPFIPSLHCKPSPRMDGNERISQAPTTTGRLHAFVIWPAATFWHGPINDLVGIGDVARLAMNAIGGVDLQLQRVALFGHFVDRRGTKILAGIAVLFHAAGGA